MTQGFGTTPGHILAVADVLRTKHGWKLSEFIGEGGSAYVYKENIRGLPRAVKIGKSHAGSTLERERLAKELRVLRDLGGHPRLLTLVEYHWVLGLLVTVWELAHGTLAKIAYEREAENQGPWPESDLERLLEWMRQAAEGIDFLNRHGVYHRDIKPQNLFLLFNQVKVGDFGLAKEATATTMSHTGAGTLGYMPPDAMAKKTHPTIDLYGLAASYVRLRTGQEPFGTTQWEIFRRIESCQFERSGMTEAEAEYVAVALHPDPKKRYAAGAVAWVEELRRILARSGEKTSIIDPGEAVVLPGDLERVRAEFAKIGASYYEDIDPVTKRSIHCFRFRSCTGDADLKNLPNPPFRFGLDLGNTQVSDAGLKELKELTKLTKLHLWGTRVTDAGLVELKGLKNLTELDLSGTQVSDAGLAELKGLKNLTKLDLRRTQVSDAGLAELKGLKNLTKLDLRRAQVSDAGLKELKELKNLTVLGLWGTRVTDAGLAELKELKNLTKLDLENTRVSDAGLVELKGLKNLTKLDLSYTRVSDAGLAKLRELKSLTVLWLRGTRVTDAGVEELRKALPNCEIYATTTASSVLAGLPEWWQRLWRRSRHRS